MELKFSDKTIAMLKNLSEIRNSVHFVAGQHIAAVNSGNSLAVNMTIDEVLPRSFVIRELNEFIGSITGAVMGGCTVSFQDQGSCLIKNGSYTVRYGFGNQMQEPANTRVFLNVENPDLVLTLNKEQFANLMTMGRFYGHTHIRVSVVNNELSVASVKILSTLIGATSAPDADKFNPFVIVIGEEVRPDVTYLAGIENVNKFIDGGVKLIFHSTEVTNKNGVVAFAPMLQAHSTAYPIKYAFQVKKY